MSETKRQRLGEYFAMDPLANEITKTWSGEYEVILYRAMFARMWVFQKGAILGRLNISRFKALLKLITIEDGEEKPNEEEELREAFKDITEKKLKRYEKEPSLFTDFLHKTMFPNTDVYDIDTMKALQSKKVRLGEVLPLFQNDVIAGIAFGITRPELVKKMWINTYEKDKDSSILDDLPQAGVELLEKEEILPLAEMEELVLKDVTEYVRKYRPSLLKPLGLDI